MEWGKIWRTVFCGWDGDVDLVALAEELAAAGGSSGAADEPEGSTWVRRQIQGAY
jgi:hypothetical protein